LQLGPAVKVHQAVLGLIDQLEGRRVERGGVPLAQEVLLVLVQGRKQAERLPVLDRRVGPRVGPRGRRLRGRGRARGQTQVEYGEGTVAHQSSPRTASMVATDRGNVPNRIRATSTLRPVGRPSSASKASGE